MKKIILCSLVAMMAVTAANAEIASVDYVDTKTGDLETLDTTATNLTDAINELVETKQDKIDNLDAIKSGAALGATSFQAANVVKELDQVPVGKDDELVPTIARAQVMIDDSQSELSAKIGDVAEGKTVVEMIGAAQEAATYDDTQVKADIATNTGAIAALDTAYKAADTALDGKITALDTAYKAADTALDGKITALDTAYKAADKAISDTIGNVAENKTVVEMIGDAQDAADAAALVAGNAQVKSTALSVGGAEGAWVDLTKVTGYSATGTHSLVLKDGNIQWEAIRY